MVATEERKMAARKTAAHEEHEEHSTSPSAASNKQPKHKDAKDKMVHESKSAGKVDYEEAEATEKKNQEVQAQRQKDARESAVQDDVQVKGRGKA